MLKKRVIARLDIRRPNLIKTRNLEGVRVVGDPQAFAARYNEAGIDEIIFMDTVASLYGRNSLGELVSRTMDDVFAPVTVGGGIRSVADAFLMLRAGADKIAINTAATHKPTLLTELALKFGSQAVVLQLDAKRTNGCWQAWRDGGREPTGLDAIEWAMLAERLGAGEILVTSIDREGTCSGFDTELISMVACNVGIPVVASGGMGTAKHAVDAIRAGADGIACAHVLHYGLMGVADIKAAVGSENIPVRQEAPISFH